DSMVAAQQSLTQNPASSYWPTPFFAFNASSRRQKMQQLPRFESCTISKGRGGIEGDFREDRENFNAIGRQPAGKRHCQRPANALTSACTFGANHRRGLPPNRSAAWWPPKVIATVLAAGMRLSGSFALGW
ncbi:MAG: hypothetical protein ACKO2L_03335, partial [Planctomycetaceae bacterium]